MDLKAVLLLLALVLAVIFAETIVVGFLNWTGIAIVWLLTFGRLDLRSGKRFENPILSIGCGLLFWVALAAFWKYIA